jgi:hypothetical protein
MNLHEYCNNLIIRKRLNHAMIVQSDAYILKNMDIGGH